MRKHAAFFFALALFLWGSGSAASSGSAALSEAAEKSGSAMF
jgi:hypothetical protein